jgi:hypothetical protein
LSDLPAVPVLDRTDLTASTVADVFVRVTALIGSANQVRRVAAGGGVRVVAEGGVDEREATAITDANRAVLEVIPAPQPGVRTFVTCGRAVVELR